MVYFKFLLPLPSNLVQHIFSIFDKMKKNTLYVLCIMAVVFCGCKNNSSGVIDGIIVNANGEKLFLEHLSGSPVIVDTLVLNESGKFSFKPQLESGGPDFFCLRIGNQSIPLAFDTVPAPIHIHADFKRFGSEYSVGDNELNNRLKEAAQECNDLRRAVLETNAAFNKREINDRVYYDSVMTLVNEYKKSVLTKYIYPNPSDPVSYYVLFESVRGLSIFDPYDAEDNRAFGAVATGWMFNYPNSPRLKMLQKVTTEGQIIKKRDKLQSEQGDSTANNIPVTVANSFELILGDIHDKPVALSSLSGNGNVTILDFTAYYLQSSPAHNALLNNMWEKYSAKGLRIYQVCFDPDENFWKVSANNVPWVAVRDKDVLWDTDGNIQYARSAATYNVQQLPMIYLLDKEGSVAARVETESKLEGEILKLLK